MSTKWQRRGMIYRPSGEGILKTHATRPIPVLIDDKTLRLFYSSRDDDDRMLPTYIDVDPNDPTTVLYAHDRPLIDLGSPGTFDDSGVTITGALNYGDELYFYYSGWKRRRVVSFELSIGMLRWDSVEQSLHRVFTGPIIGQDRSHPLFAAAPFVAYDSGSFKMWYCSGTDWRFPEGNPEPIYTVFYAESEDGINWNPRSGPVIPYKYDGEVISAPWVAKTSTGYSMWYSTRGSANKSDKNYRIGYAESKDGIEWERLDELVGIISPTAPSWDSEMACYPAIWIHNGVTHMFYSGNSVGRGGMGYAVADRQLDVVDW